MQTSLQIAFEKEHADGPVVDIPETIEGKPVQYLSVQLLGWKETVKELRIPKTISIAIYHMWEIGILQGFPDGRYGPNEFLTRAQAATVINRILYESARLSLED